MALAKAQVSQQSDQIEQHALIRGLERQAAIQPQAAFIVEAESGHELGYAQALYALYTLRRALGDQPRRIVLAFPAGIANGLLWLSALSGGHHLIPVSPNATAEEKAAIARRHRPDILCVECEEDANGFCSPQAMLLTLSECEMLIGQARPCSSLEPLEGYAYLTTSGSTGEPKWVVLSERQIAWTATQIRASHGLSSRDRGLSVLPFFHVNAPVVSLCASLLAGSMVVIARRFSRQQFWSWIERYQITWASIVPTIVAILLETARPAFLPGTLRFVRTGSAALPPADLRAFEERFGIPVIETYGLSEAASQVVANPVPPGLHKPGSAGLPTGVELRICAPREHADEQELRDVAAGEIGEICISGPAVIRAYQHNEGQEAFQAGWFRTGDLGYLDAEGYLFIKGRKREAINRGGENIAPREIEEVIQSHPAVRETAVVGRPDPIYGEQPVAYLTVREGWHAESAAQLRQHIARHLSAPKIPIDLIILDELPRNGTGKIDRRLLRTREQAHFDPTDTHG